MARCGFFECHARLYVLTKFMRQDIDFEISTAQKQLERFAIGVNMTDETFTAALRRLETAKSWINAVATASANGQAFANAEDEYEAARQAFCDVCQIRLGVTAERIQAALS